MKFVKFYKLLVRFSVSIACMVFCALIGMLAPCFLGAAIISNATFWKCFVVAFLLSAVPVLTYKEDDYD